MKLEPADVAFKTAGLPPDVLRASVRSSEGRLPRKRLVAHAALTAGISLLTLGEGVANADDLDVIGQQYGIAKVVLSQSGYSPVVSTILGNRVPQDQCFVTGISKVASFDASGNAARPSEVKVNLNCYAAQSDRKTPGFSLGNLAPEAVSSRETQDTVTRQWKGTPDGQKWCANFEAEHPEWAPIADCHVETE